MKDQAWANAQEDMLYKGYLNALTWIYRMLLGESDYEDINRFERW
jgi:hypothetical protein